MLTPLREFGKKFGSTPLKEFGLTPLREFGSTNDVLYHKQLAKLKSAGEVSIAFKKTLFMVVTQQKKRSYRKWWRLTLYIVGLLVLITIILPWAGYRITSAGRAVSVVEIPTASSLGEVPSDSFKVVTWNIAHGRGNIDTNLSGSNAEKKNRVSQIASMLQQINADIVVLNEVDFNATWSGGQNQARAIAKAAGYRWCVTQTNLDFGFAFRRWHFGNAILSRHPICDARIVDLRPLKHWEQWLVGSKCGLICEVELKGDAPSKIAVMALHLESRGEPIRVQQVDDVISTAESCSLPLIVAGDLNTTPATAPGSQKDSHGVNAFDKLIDQTKWECRPESFDNSASFTFPAGAPAKIIDWILASDDRLLFTDHRVVQTELSDHLPVVATFEYPVAQP